MYKESHTTGCWLQEFGGQFQDEICASETLCMGTVGMRDVPLLTTLVKSLCSISNLAHYC